MREVVSDDGAKVVKSLCLRIQDAAVYCGMSRSHFETHCEGLPHGGGTRSRVYHVDVLDRWIKGELDVAFVGNVKGKEV